MRTGLKSWTAVDQKSNMGCSPGHSWATRGGDWLPWAVTQSEPDRRRPVGAHGAWNTSKLAMRVRFSSPALSTSLVRAAFATPPCAFTRAHWARATTWALTFWATDRPSEPQLRRSGSRCAGADGLVTAEPAPHFRVSDQLSDHYCADVSSAMGFRTRWRIWSQIYRTWSRLIRPGRPNPVLVAFLMEIGARVAAAHCDHHVEGFTALRISDCSVAVSMPSRPWP
jgi:hypothetical protein